MNKGKVIRISPETANYIEDLKFKLENMYYEHIGGQISIREDDIIRDALKERIEKINKLI